MRRNSDSGLMTGLGRQGRRVLRDLFLLALLPAGMAHASSMTSLAVWDRYLEGGPSLWARVAPPDITNNIHVVMWEGLRGADPAANPDVQYLLWRQSLDPPRFDHYHPRVAAALQSLLPAATSAPSPSASPAPEAEQAGGPPPATTGSTPPPVTPPPATGPESLTPPPSDSPPPAAIPEPETLPMALILIAAGLWWRFRQPRPAGAPPTPTG
jgi:hypothetical protein